MSIEINEKSVNIVIKALVKDFISLTEGYLALEH